MYVIKIPISKQFYSYFKVKYFVLVPVSSSSLQLQPIPPNCNPLRLFLYRYNLYDQPPVPFTIRPWRRHSKPSKRTNVYLPHASLNFRSELTVGPPFIYLSLRLTGTALELSWERKIERRKDFAAAAIASDVMRFMWTEDKRIIF